MEIVGDEVAKDFSDMAVGGSGAVDESARKHSILLQGARSRRDANQRLNKNAEAPMAEHIPRILFRDEKHLSI
ncbi:hypothetical protein V6N13_010004 [Hibiscus sabdariffa]